MSIALGNGIGRLRAIVLISDPVIGDHWKDFRSSHTTLEGLTDRLRTGTQKRRWVAWRIVQIESEGGFAESRSR